MAITRPSITLTLIHRCVDLKSGDTKGVYRGHDHVIQSIALMSSEKMNGMDAQVGGVGAHSNPNSNQVVRGWGPL